MDVDNTRNLISCFFGPRLTYSCITDVTAHYSHLRHQRVTRPQMFQCAYMYNVIVTQTVIKTCFVHRFHTTEQYSKIGLAYSLKADVINLLIPVFLTQSNELAVCLITHVIDVR